MSPAWRSVVVLTGAGVSADSGIATFRGPGGLWEGEPIEAVATPEGWRRDPARVWAFYQRRRAKLLTVEPNPAHFALARLERSLREIGAGFTLITQNVDDLHERAGSRSPLHMHGELGLLRCELCGGTLRDRHSVDPESFVPCPDCGHERLRPAVVWFGEIPQHLGEIDEALAGCTDFLAVGTSGVVTPAALLLEGARAGGARTQVVSLDAPENLDPRDRFVEGRASEVLPAVVDELLR